MSAKPAPTLAQLAEKIALELVFAEPGKDGGLLPINSLLGEIENQSATAPQPAPLQEAIALARRAVDAALEAGAMPDRLHERENVSRRGGPIIYNKIGVLRRDQGSTDTHALQAQLVNQPASRGGSRIPEYAPGARRRRLRLPSFPAVVVHALLDRLALA